MSRGRRPGKGVGAWRGHPAELVSPSSVRREGDCARSGRRRGRDRGRAGGLALSVTAPSGPILPGRRCPWMRPPRAPRPVSLPAARARHCRHPFPGSCTARSGRLSGARCPRPAQSASGRCFHAPGGGSVVPLAGKGTAGVGQRAPCSRAARSGSLRLAGSRCISVELLSGWGNVRCLRGTGSPPV